MTKIKAYVAEHEIAKTLISTLEFVLMVTFCLGSAPALIWLSQL